MKDYKKNMTIQTLFPGFRPFEYALLSILYLYFIMGVEIGQ